MLCFNDTCALDIASTIETDFQAFLISMAESKQETALEKGTETQHVDTPPDDALVEDAKHASDAEHQMTLLQAIKTYPKAIGWSVLLSTTLIMEGYDLALLGSLYASPVFNQKYGVYIPAQDEYDISAAWQSGLSNGARAGEIFGLIIAGWTADRYGYKVTTAGALVLMICFIFVLFFAPNLQVLVVGEILCGKSVTLALTFNLMKLQAFHGEPSNP